MTCHVYRLFNMALTPYFIALQFGLVFGFLFHDSADFSFTNGRLIGTVSDERVVKISGCAASRKHPGVLYIHNDHHHAGATIFAINASNAHVIGSIMLTNAVNADWEDIAVGPCPLRPAESCIFIGDIGTDKGHPAASNIYLISEPDIVTGNHNMSYEKQLQFSYAESGSDPNMVQGDIGSDTLMVDNHGEMYIIGIQRGGDGGYYHIPKLGWTHQERVPIKTDIHMALNTGHEKDPVAGDISPDGTGMLIKTQQNMLLWRFASAHWQDVFKSQPMRVPYTYVWQDEAVCWSHDGRGYYTIPEGTNPPLHFYSSVDSGNGSQ